MKITTMLSGIAGLAIAAGAHAQLAFSSSTISAAERPSTAAIADLNGDGFNDIAVTTDNPDKISVFLGSAAGTFAFSFSIPTGSGSGLEDIEAADLDGDGDIDLVVTLQNFNQARAYINTGGTFSAGSSAPIGNEARGMVAADLDGDGDADFAVANRDDNTFTVIRNNAGVLTSQTFAAGDEPRAAAAGDFNADGLMDIAISNHDGRNVSVHMNVGGASFGAPTFYTTGGATRPEGITAGDVDNDGRIDIIAATSDDNPNQNFATVLFNSGGGFGAPMNFPTGSFGANDVAAADLDGDGTLDAIVTNQDANTVSLLPGTGAGFGAPQVIPTPARPDHIALGDLDNNGTMDFTITHRDVNLASLFVNSLTPPDCPADWDNSGGVDGDDITAFFADWQMGNGDIDNSGGTDGDDIAFFFTRWQAGC